MSRSATLLAAGLLIAGFSLASSACGGHKTSQPPRHGRTPTAAERRSLFQGLRSWDVGDTRAFVASSIHSESVSTVNPAWASVKYGTLKLLFHWQGRYWEPVTESDRGQPVDGGCAYAPADVMSDLFGIACPPERAVHARVATAAETAALRAALRSDSVTRPFGDVPIEHCGPGSRCKPRSCISRLDSRWASALMDFSSTGGVVWFRRIGLRWRIAYETSSIEKTRTLPPHAIVLSLASCVGYNAAQYGG